MIDIRRNSRKALADSQLQKNLLLTLSKTMAARNQVVAEVDNWEALRTHAQTVKAHTVANLGKYLETLESRVIAQGGQVLWADDAREAVDYLLDIARRYSATKVVKSKSMLGEEIHLNHELERANIASIETDLGEYIVQLADETPSHIVMPALHKSREQVADLFAEKLGMERTEDVERITLTARQVLRQHFLTAQMGISGVNFAVAETGSIVVVENEGNARLSVSLPPVHVAIMGIEKVIPRTEDLCVFLKLLTRNATGQKISTYVNFVNGGRRDDERDGPSDFYLIILDNGRSQILKDEYLSQTLHCIRCGACLDTCPVYQSIGGHAYISTYQGPIGAILTPQLLSMDEAREHPFASSLCGACHDICPVKIEIPHILLKLRDQAQRESGGKASKISAERIILQIWSWFMQSASRYRQASWVARRLQPLFIRTGKRFPVGPLRAWSEKREIPQLATKSFREMFVAEEGEK